MNASKLFRTGKRYIYDPKFRFNVNRVLGMYNLLPDEEYLRRLFRITIGKELNLDNPQTFNEKLQWLKLYDRKPEYTHMADKCEAKKYVAERIGEEYIIPTLGIWDNPDDIDFDALPDQFVLKCNHNSGLGMCICSDKSKLDINKVRKELKKGLKQNYYLTGREWPYKNIPHQVLAEQFLSDNSGSGLVDYKVMCFGGKAQLIQVHKGRFTAHTQDFYDTKWRQLDFEQGCPRSELPIEKPSVLDEMIELSEKLAENIPQLRVDWYCLDNKLYFGELTFFDGSGFFSFDPQQWDYILGSWIVLPKKTIN